MSRVDNFKPVKIGYIHPDVDIPPLSTLPPFLRLQIHIFFASPRASWLSQGFSVSKTTLVEYHEISSQPLFPLFLYGIPGLYP